MRIPYFLGILALLVACSSTKNMDSSKLDAPLRRALEALDESAPDILQVMVKCQAAVNDDRRADLEATGASIGTVAGDIVTMRATKAQITSLANLELVTSVSLSTTSKPLNQ